MYKFNENYLLKNDRKRFLIIRKQSHETFLDSDADNETEDVNSIIHPLIALLLFLFDGSRSKETVAAEYSKILGVDKGHIRKLVEELIKASRGQKGKFLKFADDFFFIPKNIIVNGKTGRIKKQSFDINDFLIPKSELDLKSLRYYSPIDCILEVNFKCYTDCIYCYADRRSNTQCSIPIERLKEIIHEAKQIGMRSFDLCGGEIFLYDPWEILVSELIENGFRPYISTKIPLSKRTIRRLKDIGVNEIQLSIDSIVPDELAEMLMVEASYFEKITETLRDLDAEGFSIFINSQLTKFNDNPENMKKHLDFFLTFNSIKSIKVGAVGNSLYKPPGNHIRIASSLDRIKAISEIVEQYRSNHNGISINFSGYSTKDKFVGEFNEKKEKYRERARCSGNFYSFIILPDGKVTICEELYSHPAFIIGDLMEQSIEEVWNSDRAIRLYKLPPEQIREESACRDCIEYEYCRQFKGVCWKEILNAYGYDKWDYPDPKCPYAPEPSNKFWYE